MNKGFSTILVLFLVLFGTFVSAGVGYVVFKINQFEHDFFAGKNKGNKENSDTEFNADFTPGVVVVRNGKNVISQGTSTPTALLREIDSFELPIIPEIRPPNIYTSQEITLPEPKNENFNAIAEHYWKNQTEKAVVIITYIDELLSYIKSDIDRISSVKSQVTNNATSSSSLVDVSMQNLINLYDEDIQIRQRKYNNIKAQKDFLLTIINDVAPNFISEAQQQFFTREIASDYSRAMLPHSKYIQESFEKVERNWQNYLLHRDKVTNFYLELVATATTRDQMQPTPNFSSLKTNTDCAVIGSTISCLQ
jgi:hypothetical protein